METLLSIIIYLSELHLLLKASLILCILYLPYHMVFQNTTSFLVNRVYLISTILLTCIVPFLGIEAFPILFSAIKTVPGNTEAIAGADFNIFKLISEAIGLIYIAGVVFLLIKKGTKIQHLLKNIQSCEKVPSGHFTLVMESGFPVSSFFRYIFLEDESADELLLKHEMIHVQEKHSYDVLLAELFISIFWFHPFAYMLRKSITLNHEYYCDYKMSELYSYEKYGDFMLKYLNTNSLDHILNHFYSFTKKRFIMMSTLKNNPQRSNHYLTMFLTLLTCFVLFSFKPYYVPIGNEASGATLTDTLPPAQNGTNPKNLSSVPELDEAETILKYPEIVTSVDTIFNFNYDTKVEEMRIVKSQVVKGYQMLIEAEYQKSDPNQELILKWRREGNRN